MSFGSAPRAVFVAAISCSAFLLFWLQPLVAKLLLPGLGGAPAVWVVCVVFFQAMLLGGYAYAHLSRSRLSPRVQARVQVGLLLLALASLPIRIEVAAAPSGGVEPTLWLLGTLVLNVAPAFFAASATAPLLQGWFAASGRDPYPLYAASNLGSFAALLAFPWLLEPQLDLDTQKRAWAACFAGLAALTALCGRKLDAAPPTVLASTPPSGRDRAAWLALSLVPSALLIGATRHISTDVAPVPLLWVLPLALYLLSFVNAFAARPWVSTRGASIMAVLALAGVATYRRFAGGTPSLVLLVGLHCFVLLTVSLALHGRLAQRRPAAERLSEFYLWLSLGGVLGGIFAALLAPLWFVSALEYSLALVAACALLPGAWPALRKTLAPAPAPKRDRARKRDAATTPLAARRPLADVLDLAAAPALAIALWLAARGTLAPMPLAWITLALLLSGVLRPLRLALTMAVLYFGPLVVGDGSDVLHRSRNFFGTLVVREQDDLRLLLHGTTQHGGQSLVPMRSGQPLAYFHPLGPIGRLFMKHRGTPLTRDVGIVGLGVGSLVSYASQGERWTFYEIDPDVIRVATDPNLFTLVAQAHVKPRIVLGDARQKLGDEPDGRYSLLVLDAFTSDATPMHLLTREAFATYRDKLAPDGVIMAHVSSRYLDLAPIIASTARELGMSARRAFDTDDLSRGTGDWKLASDWVFLARDSASLALLRELPLWREIDTTQAAPWTDRYSNLVSALGRR